MVQRPQNIFAALGFSKEFDEPFLLARNDEGTDRCGFMFDVAHH
jgi:hypothetical protein